ncbi:MAG: CRISPR-associated helicase Cas3' [Anaerolineae bacterium]|nr:CRISPR-associated helicase Cas3' [Anaerolineae bacterium]
MVSNLHLDDPPYKYQDDVCTRFLDGQNLIIQAPTGAGKTRAALEPNIIGFQREPLTAYPQRIIYNVPMRVLARGFYEEYDSRARLKAWKPEWQPTIQTGETPDDSLFEGRVIFCTVDQMLASFLNIPYSLPKRLDNINAGAMIGSAFIFDEFHLYPQREMMLTVLAMLRMLQGLSRFILMSATFSPVFLKEIGRALGAEVIADPAGTPLAQGHFSDITALTTRQRTFYAEDGPLTAEAVLARMGGAERVLCVCNTVDRAQQLFLDLRRELDGDGECRLLHSRFYRDDRRATENFAIQQFKEKPGQRVVLVATQVVEVGLDISSEALFTECAPAASIIQRAGRCARREGETGRVHVFQPYDDEGNLNYAPYKDEGQEAICHKTWDALNLDEFRGKVIGFPEEQQLVKLAHEEADQAFIDGLDARIDARIGEITDCMLKRDAGYADSLIRQRDTNAAQLFIHDKPNQDDRLTEKPWRREALSISKGRLARAFEQMPAAGEIDAEFLLCVENAREIDEYTTEYAWEPVREKSEIFANWRFVAHPHAVTYTPELGLILQPGNVPATPSPDAPEKPWDQPVYEAERFYEHINGLQLAYTSQRTISKRVSNGQFAKHTLSPLCAEVDYPLRRLCARLGRDVEQAERLLRLTLALHDVGKLNTPWQAWARAWQRLRQENGYPPGVIPLDDDAPLAHTDYDSDNEAERALQKQLNRRMKRGPHAGESAQACLPIVWEATGGDPFWMAVVVGAIMRHHTPDVDNAGPFRLSPGSGPALTHALSLFEFEQEAARWAGSVTAGFERGSGALRNAVEGITPSYSSYDAALMYFVFVRALRLADQRSGGYWKDYRHTNLVAGEEKRGD